RTASRAGLIRLAFPPSLCQPATMPTVCLLDWNSRHVPGRTATFWAGLSPTNKPRDIAKRPYSRNDDATSAHAFLSPTSAFRAFASVLSLGTARRINREHLL